MPISRRTFLNTTAVGVSSGVAAGAGQPATAVDASQVSVRLPREVWVATICQAGLQADSPAEMVKRMLRRMEETISLRPDIICLPEMFHTANVKGLKRPIAETSEQPIGTISQPIADFARQNHCNVICPISTVDEGRYYNSALVIDRDGKLVGEYRKINPTEDELAQGLLPGPLDPPVFKLDFGTIGIQTCYDVNWHDNWRHLRQQGAEIIFWPSAFAGGKMLNALAWINKVFVVSSTRIHSSKIVDVLGDDLAETGRFDTWICRPINLAVAVVQTHRNINRLEGVREKYGRKIDIRVWQTEAWARLESCSTDVSLRDVLREFDLETSEEMLARETARQNDLRP